MSRLPTGTPDVLWYSREKDASWLADEVRRSRLTVLQGDLGSGKSTLLRWGVLPRLRRRVDDPAAAAIARTLGKLPEDRSLDERRSDTARSVVVPFPDRRRNSSAGDVEVVVYVDSWTAIPLESLMSALRDALALPPSGGEFDASMSLGDALARHGRRHGVRFLFVLDDFDDCLEASIYDPAARAFVDQWVRAVVHPTARANFIIAMARPAEPLWALLAQHAPDAGSIEDHRLSLPAVPPGLLPESDDISVRLSMLTSTAGFQSSHLSDANATSADGSTRNAPEVLGDAAAAVGSPSMFDTANVMTAAPAVEASSSRVLPADHRARTARVVGLALVAAALAAGIYVVGWRSELPSVMRFSGTASGNHDASADTLGALAPSGLPAPGFELVADAGDSSDDMIVSELARLLRPEGHAVPAVRFPFGWSAELAAVTESPRLAMVTGDVLRVARATRPDAPIRVVAPLFKEEIYFVVRNDSPLRYIHEIRTARINVGPARGSRSLTAGNVYERMFGKPIPPRQLDAESREQAVERLLAGKSLDVLALVNAQPDPWLVRHARAGKRSLRVLELDASTAAGRAATSAYPQTPVWASPSNGVAARHGATTLSVMSYLVTGPASKADATEQPLREAAAAICRNLALLQRSGHPKWKEFRIGSDAGDSGWPLASEAAADLSACAPR